MAFHLHWELSYPHANYPPRATASTRAGACTEPRLAEPRAALFPLAERLGQSAGRTTSVGWYKGLDPSDPSTAARVVGVDAEREEQHEATGI